MISSFGPKASAYVQRLGDLEAIVTDAQFIGQAYREAVRRRELGESFYGLVCVDDRRLGFAYAFGAEMVAQIPDYDARCDALERFAAGSLIVNGKRADELWVSDRSLEHVCTEFLWLCDAVLVRSFEEYARVEGWFARDPLLRPMRPVEPILAPSAVPVVERVRPDRPGLVVWGPDWPAAAAALPLHGLAEFHGELTCVTAGGPLPSYSQATFLTADDPALASALGRAAAVVCIDPSDPSDAVAFARQGFGVVAPFCSGAHEFADNVVPCDPLEAKQLFTAAAVAITRPASVRAEPPRPPRAPMRPERPAFVDPQTLPLVTIITPTYNRRDDLERMLSCLAAQTYPNLESVVVNDGGEAVDDIVAKFPFARLVNKRPNAGTARAQLTGFEHARGEYIGLLPDDDWLYPDHVDRLMNAMFRSGAKVVHGAGLLRYLKRLDTGAWMTAGFNATTFCQTLVASDALVTSSIGGHQTLIHRSVYEDVGWYLLDSDISDNEWHIRGTQRYVYAFVDAVTTEFRDHAGGQGKNLDLSVAMRQVYAELHPRPDRPVLEQMREHTAAYVAKRVRGVYPFPPTLEIHF